MTVAVIGGELMMIKDGKLLAEADAASAPIGFTHDSTRTYMF